MDISYRLNNSEIGKLKECKNPSILLKNNDILKNGKYKLHLTVGMFNYLKMVNYGTFLLIKGKNIIFKMEVH